MSLGRRYYLMCESRQVVQLIGQDWLVPTLQVGCTLVSPTSDSAKQARRNAAKLGWTRPLVRYPIVVGTSTAKFDLCHRCTQTVTKMLGDLPK